METEIKKVEEVKEVKQKAKKEEAKDVSAQIEELKNLVVAMSEKDKEKTEQIEMLMSIADESRKDKFDAKKRVKIIPRVKLTTLNGKIVVGSRTIIDEVYKDLSDKGNWVEKQIHNYTLEDGTNIDLPLPQYTRIRQFVEADVVAIKSIPEKEGPNGESFYRYTLKVVDGGREIEVDYQYIN